MNGKSRALVAVLAAGAALAAAAQQPQREFRPDSIVNPEAFYPEGPQLTEAGLLVAEMPRNRVVRVNPQGGGTATVWEREACGPTSVKKIPSGGYWILCHLGHHVVRVDAQFRTVKVIDTTTGGRRLTWPNDGSVDSAGDLYLSSSGLFNLRAPPEGRVVFIDERTNRASDLAGGLRYTNGVLVQESRHRVLVSETLNRRMWSFPLLGRGQLGTPSVFFDFHSAPEVPDAYDLSGPDGISAFADGQILVADYGNGRLLHLTGDGRFIQELPVTYRFVTNMAIAPDESALYIVMTRDNATRELDGMVQRFKVLPARRAP
jgi:sugar lactone lactonase YvrE